MNLDEMIKYLLWIALFAAALYGLYSLFGRLGVL